MVLQPTVSKALASIYLLDHQHHEARQHKSDVNKQIRADSASWKMVTWNKRGYAAISDEEV
ncbi:MAG: hypothetical protein ACJAVO_000165 [Parvibaculaceae bacterium]|jgi:hypothetical protein